MGRKPCGRHPPELRVYRTARVPRRRGTSTEAPGHPDGLSRTLIPRRYLGNRAPAKNRFAPNRGVVLLCSGPRRTVGLLGDGPASRRMKSRPVPKALEQRPGKHQVRHAQRRREGLREAAHADCHSWPNLEESDSPLGGATESFGVTLGVDEAAGKITTLAIAPVGPEMFQDGGIEYVDQNKQAIRAGGPRCYRPGPLLEYGNYCHRERMQRGIFCHLSLL